MENIHKTQNETTAKIVGEGRYYSRHVAMCIYIQAMFISTETVIIT